MKRLLDLALVILTAPLALPLALAIAAAIRLTDGAPVLFVSDRAGLNGKVFRFLKFRTMRPGPGTDMERLTRLGRRLRSSSLDELPQLWHVLRGEMSLVGPRPLPAEYLPRYDEAARRRHEVRPGITGWAQVNGRNAISWERKFALDVWYVDHRSLGLDLKILWLTLVAVFSRKGIDRSVFDTMEAYKGGNLG